MKRFWKTASVQAEGEGWTVLLDCKPVRVPGRGVLRLGTRALAEAVAAEWQAAGGGQGGDARPEDLCLTRLAGTAQDRVAPDSAPMVAELVRYGAHDLLCYRATGPDALVRREEERWQPWLDWAEGRYGAKLRVTAGIGHVSQPVQSIAALQDALSAQSVPVVAALGVAVPALGSLVLGLAMVEGALPADHAYELSVLDEAFQIEQWGDDSEASARRASLREDVLLAERFMQLSRP